MENNIVYSYITEYLQENILPNDGHLKKLEKYAYKHNVPIVSPEVAKFILIIAQIVNPNNILEVGTAIGYSAILLSDTLKHNGQLTTIEKDNTMADIEIRNIDKANKQNIINVFKAGGVLISDNVLYKGMVATDDLIEPRKKTIVKRLRDYNKKIINHPKLNSSIIPIGDGVAISYKKGKEDE